MLKVVVTVFILLIGFIYVDYSLADRANLQIISDEDLLDNIIANSHLDFDGPRKQSCVVGRKYLFYFYQLCFFLWKDQKDSGRSFFQLIYHRPKAILQFYGRPENSLYFSEPTLGTKVGEVYRQQK